MDENRKRCPRCQQPVDEMNDRLYWCPQCKMATDCEDDGDIGYGSQERYAQRKEEYEIRQRNRKPKQSPQDYQCGTRTRDRRRR